MTKVFESMKFTCRQHSPEHMRSVQKKRGASLITVLLILVIVSLVGIGAAQIALMSERGSRNSRDMQVAWQSAEAALADADIDLFSNTAGASRKDIFDGKSLVFFPNAGCGTSGNLKGLCSSVSSGKPNWLVVDFTSSTGVATLGDYTGRNFTAGGTGIQPALKPRYVIEPVIVPVGSRSDPEAQEIVYRVTAMGFGPKAEIQAVLQMLYRI